MNRVSVTYAAPVQVDVDLDTGEIVRVLVCDQEVSRDRNLIPGGDQPSGPNGTGIPLNDYLVVRPYFGALDRDEEPTADEIERAYAIADDGNTAWPFWQIGEN